MIGQYIQNYKIVAHLGEGGMGAVYRATDTVLGREVALKMLHSPLMNQPQFLERFKKEARMLAQLLHPNIAVIYNFIEQDGQNYMVMEYVEGQNLDVLLRKFKPLTYKMVVPLFIQALEGLHHAHKKGIYHRDIKPSNLILTPDGTVKLMDFGIAKMAGDQKLTQVNRVVGTIEFMAPELIEGKDPSMASDIYATGVTMYELLTGSLPFENKSDFNLMQEILKKKPATIDRMNSNVPKALSDIVMKALEKKPEHRFADARAFQQALLSAFPYLKEIDPALVNGSFNTAPATQVVQVVTTQPKTELYDPLLQATRVENTTRPGGVGVIKKLQHQFLSNKRRNLVIAGILLLLVLAGIFTFTSNKKEAIVLSKADSTNLQINPVNDLPKNDTAGDNGGTNIPVVVDKPADNPRYSPVTPVTPVDDGKGTGRKEKPANPPAQKKKIVEEDDDPPAVVEEKPVIKTPKTVTIRTRAVVKVKLSQTLNPKSLNEGQSLQFTVISDVEYDDEIIIRRGATAYGTLTGVGSMLIDIDINSVETAGGQRLNLDRAKFKGKRRDVADTREIYSFTLGKGTTIRL